MIKKIFILLILVTLTSCDYEPIYSKKNNTNELINKIELSGDKKINRAITSADLFKTKCGVLSPTWHRKYQTNKSRIGSASNPVEP